jgi:cyclic pyranopterin phosphate synthase
MKTRSKTLTHLDARGQACMVSVSHKPAQARRAVARGELLCQPATLRAVRRQALPKGDVLAVARVAGIQAAKRTAELIPLCHPLPLSHVAVDFRLRRDRVEIECTVETVAQTGVEMEALTGVMAAALAWYDMCKAVDSSMRIEAVRLVEKTKGLASPPTP